MCFGAHFVAYLATETGHEIDSISIMGAGALQARNSLRIRQDKMAGKKVGLILSGGNADKDLFVRALG